jgi:hypothetical protein
MNESKDSDFGGANPSYRGYDYQKLVTVWVALDLMFGSSPSALEIIVEPASHDDVKAKLEVSSEKAEANLRIPGTELHVQGKRGIVHRRTQCDRRANFHLRARLAGGLAISEVAQK